MKIIILLFHLFAVCYYGYSLAKDIDKLTTEFRRTKDE
jgi:hypothetical protein